MFALPLYYFELDQTRELGMITPHWDKHFFDTYVPSTYQTRIVLDRVCDSSTNFSTALQADVDAIDPILILFLRRIERLSLSLRTSTDLIQPIISKCFKRVNWTANSGIVGLIDENANTIRWLYKQQVPIIFSGLETRRPNITNTEIVLAFPVVEQAGTYSAQTNCRNLAFAYLPIGDFGFKV